MMETFALCLWMAGTSCFTEPQDYSHGRKGMTEYMAQKYGGPKKKRKRPSPKKKDIWEDLED